MVRAATVAGSRDGYDVMRCAACRCMWRTPVLGHVRQTHMPREGDKYRGAWYHADMCRDQRIPTFADRFTHDRKVADLRIGTLLEFRDLVHSLMVDVGCGNGAFVAAALDVGANAFGLDLGVPLLDWAMSEHPQLAGRLLVGTVPPRGEHRWDVVTYHDSIEHMVDPYAALVAAGLTMADRGLLVIEAPDPTCPEAEADPVTWRHTKPREHTMLLSPAVWRSMLRAAGFRPIRTTTPIPMKLAIYSERVR